MYSIMLWLSIKNDYATYSKHFFKSIILAAILIFVAIVYYLLKDENARTLIKNTIKNVEHDIEELYEINVHDIKYNLASGKNNDIFSTLIIIRFASWYNNICMTHQEIMVFIMVINSSLV